MNEFRREGGIKEMQASVCISCFPGVRVKARLNSGRCSEMQILGATVQYLCDVLLHAAHNCTRGERQQATPSAPSVPSHPAHAETPCSTAAQRSDRHSATAEGESLYHSR
ncbi:MAG: hypothetical protein ACI4BC_06480 [Muribaculaceae bacterium]